MTIGVIGAMQMEVDDLKAQMTDTQTEVYSGVEFVEGVSVTRIQSYIRIVARQYLFIIQLSQYGVFGRLAVRRHWSEGPLPTSH